MKDKIVSKYQIDFDNLQGVTTLSPVKKYLSWLQNTFVGGIGGMGVGSTIVFILSWALVAIAGITLATMFTTLAAVTGGVLIGVFSFIYARNQTRIDELTLETSQTSFENNKKDLQNNLITLAKTLHSFNEIIKVRYNSLVKEGVIDDNRVEFAKALDGDQHVATLRKNLGEKNPSLDELQKIIEVRRNLLRHLCANLSIVSGGSYTEKLAKLFGTSEKDLIKTVGDTLGENNSPEIGEGFASLIHELKRMPQLNVIDSDLSIGKADDRDGIRQNFVNLKTTLEKQYNDELKLKHSKIFRKLTTSYGMAAISGFFTGVGGYVAIGALVAGGAAALIASPAVLPIFVGGLAVGLLGLGVSVLYRRHVEKKKQLATKLLTRTNTSVGIVSKAIETENNKSLELINQLKKQEEEKRTEEKNDNAFNFGMKVGRLDEAFKTFEKNVIEINKKYPKLIPRMNALNDAARMYKSPLEERKLHNQVLLKDLQSLEREYTELKDVCEKRLAEEDVPKEKVPRVAQLFENIEEQLHMVIASIEKLEQNNKFHLVEEGEKVNQTSIREATLPEESDEEDENGYKRKSPSN